MRVTNLVLFGVTTLVLGCGPKVEGPFEGEGRYEGQYEGESPRGWGEHAPEQGQARTDPGTDQVGTNGVPPAEGQAQTPAPAEAPPVEQPSPAPQPAEETAQAEPVPTADPGQSLGALREDIQAFRASNDPAHAELLDGLRQLVQLLGTVPGGNEAQYQLRQIEGYANRIQNSDVNSMQHSTWTRAALREGVDALTSIARAQDRELPALADLRAQVDALPTGVALLGEREQYAAAFDEMTAAIEVLSREPAPAGTR